MIVAGVVALTTAAATAGAAAAAGTYGIYKYLKKKRNRQARDGDKESDFGQELEVYKVTETKIPPPVAPKPKRGERRATVVTVQPGVERSEAAVNGRGVAGGHEGLGSNGAGDCRLSNAALITRLCPNAVKVLPDPPEHGIVLSSNRRRTDSQINCKAATSASAKDCDQNTFSKDAVRMKTLQRNLEEELL